MERFMKIIDKLKCLIGYHSWTYTIQDCIDEFGFIPLDQRMPSTAKCCKCNVKFKKKQYGKDTNSRRFYKGQ